MLFDQPEAEDAGCARDLALYVLIGCAVVAATWTLAIYSAKFGWTPNLVANWTGFGLVTAIAFWDTARVLRRHRRRRMWLAWATALALQLVVGTVVLGRLPRVPVVLWGIVLPIDELAIGACLSLVTESGLAARRMKTSGRTRG